MCDNERSTSAVWLESERQLSLMSFLLHAVGGLFFDRPAQRYTKDALLGRLETQQTKLVEKFRSSPQTPRNASVFTHIIGIERWAHTRLRTRLGAPLRATEEYDQYRPPNTTPFYELAKLFEEARNETIAIARAIPVDEYKQRIPHNQWGQLTVAGWLNYLIVHAWAESQKVR
jgi:hypothetical protein